MKICEEYASLLDPFVDGELTGSEARRVREHLVSCPACAAYAADAMAIRAAFGDLEGTEVPAGLADGVMAVIRAHAAPRKRNLLWLKTAASLAACAAIVFAAARIALFVDSPRANAPMAAVAESGSASMKTQAGDSAEAGAAGGGTSGESNSAETYDNENPSSSAQPYGARDSSVPDDSTAASAQEAPFSLLMVPESEADAGEDVWTEYENVVFAGVVRLPRTQQLAGLLSDREGKPYSSARGGDTGTGYAMTWEELKPILEQVGDGSQPAINPDRTTELYCLVVTDP